MSMQASITMLNRATKGLEHAWHRASADWRDARSRSFEQTYVAELQPRIRSALSGMAAMDRLITRARHDCE